MGGGQTMQSRIKAAILGSGHISRDLYRKIDRSEFIDLELVASRNLKSEGSIEALSFSRSVSDKGIEDVIRYREEIDLVFDCTSAKAHIDNYSLLSANQLRVIDLTPSGIGIGIIPAVNIAEAKEHDNINLISCGGQSSIPILYHLCKYLRESGCIPDYVEVSSAISSKSAGMATRYNIDNYIIQTSNSISKFCKVRSKVILNINPGDPPIKMETSISVLFSGLVSEHDLLQAISKPIEYIQRYLPGYRLLVEPRLLEPHRIFCSISVAGHGHHLPAYAGNLDIITSAAIQVAHELRAEL
jgi:acetaldehyde dehydrogenase